MQLTNVLDFGASSDGMQSCTEPFQAAIDQCHTRGGGVVEIPPGVYLCGTLYLRDNVAIEIAHGATIKMNRDDDDFADYETITYDSYSDHETTYFHYALFMGEEVDNIAIRGSGMIDGNGYQRGGPKPIALKSCTNIEIKGITIRMPPNYGISMIDCEYILIDGVKIQQGLADGIDPDGCRNLIIANCLIESGDDAIVPKTSPALGRIIECANITVSNCLIGTSAYGFKLGTESSGDFRNISVSNCTIYPLGYAHSPVAGIALEAVDGAHIMGISISNITMQSAMCPIFLCLGNRGRAQPLPTPGCIQDVTISNVVARNASLACVIAGIPGHPVRRVNIDNVIVEYGYIAPEDKKSPCLGIDTLESESGYPDPRMYGPLPASGWFCRHVEDLRVQSQNFTLVREDIRPMVMLDDIADLQFKEMKFLWQPHPLGPDNDSNQTAFVLRNVQDSQFEAIKITSGRSPLLHIIGADSNQLSFRKTPFSVKNKNVFMGSDEGCTTDSQNILFE